MKIMNNEWEGIAKLPIPKTELLAGTTQEAMLVYPGEVVTVTYGTNSEGLTVISDLNISVRDVKNNRTTQPFPKYLNNPVSFEFVKKEGVIEGQTIPYFFEGVLLGENTDIRKISAVTELLISQLPEEFSGIESVENIKSTLNRYYSVMVSTLEKYSTDPRVREQMLSYLEVYKRNGRFRLLESKLEVAQSFRQFAKPIDSDPWMKTDEFQVYQGGQEVLTFTHKGDLTTDGVVDPKKVLVTLNLEFVPAAQNLQIILTGGGIQKFSNPEKHSKIFRGKDGSIDTALRDKVMAFHSYLIAALKLLDAQDHTPSQDPTEIADAACTVIMEAIQETEESLIPEYWPDLTNPSLQEISEFVNNFIPIDLKPNPEIATVVTSILFPKVTGEYIENATNTADEVLQPVPLKMPLEELLILINEGLIEDQRIISAVGIYLAKELFNLN